MSRHPVCSGVSAPSCCHRTRSSGLRGTRVREEAGIVLVVSLLVMSLLSALLLSSVAVVALESREAFVLREGQRVRDAALSGFHAACDGLGRAASWSAVLTGLEPSAFISTSPVRLRADQSVVVDVDARGARLQRRFDADASFGANQPDWQLYLSAHLGDIVSRPLGRGDVLVAAWVADDGSESDGDARADSNGVLMVHVEAYGAAGTRAVVRATVAREPGWAAVRTRWISYAP